jgi:hypothetical protein
MTATKFRLILAGVIVVLLLGFGAGAYFMLGILSDRVRQTDHTKVDADITTTELQQLKNLQKQLADQSDVVSRAKEIAATTAQYKYQDQVISDISVYAARYGIRISTFDFSIAQTVKPEASTGAKKTPFTLTLKGPIAFTTFLRFLQDIEHNLTKIQVTSLTLSPDKNPNNVANPTVGLAVYLNN